MATPEESSYSPEIAEAWHRASDLIVPMPERLAATKKVAEWMQEMATPLEQRIRASEDGC